MEMDGLQLILAIINSKEYSSNLIPTTFCDKSAKKK